MNEKEYDYIRNKFFEDWYQSGGCDCTDEELFWYGYNVCKNLNDNVKQAVNKEIEVMTSES